MSEQGGVILIKARPTVGVKRRGKTNSLEGPGATPSGGESVVSPIAQPIPTAGVVYNDRPDPFFRLVDRFAVTGPRHHVPALGEPFERVSVPFQRPFKADVSAADVRRLLAKRSWKRYQWTGVRPRLELGIQTVVIIKAR
jgi:hypothetical protein